MQFGSLNQEGGSNRINVAITRAKEQVYIVTSILPNQLAVSESKNEGPKILKKYLEYAYNISNSNIVAVDFGNVKNSNFYLSDKILSDNSVNTSIKSASVTDFTDMIVLKNNFIQKLLLTDDQKYQDVKSIKDYHAYRPMRIKTLNWKYKMLHSRNYFLNKYKFMDSLNDFIKL